jgi:penicillin amidase
LAGKVPLRVEGHDGRVPVPGWTGEHEWLGTVPFEHWPHAINPPDGMLVTANAKPVGDAYPYYLGNCWLPGFRAARITELLQDAQGLNVADFCGMQFDQVSILARRVGQQLSGIELVAPYATPNTQSALRLFQDWDGHLAANSPTAAIYQVFIRRLLYNLFGTVAGDLSDAPDLDDRFVGKGPHPLLAASSPISGPNGRALIAHLLDTPDSPLFRQRSRDDLMLQSLREAVEFLEWKLGMQVEDWRWGDLHQLTYNHPLGQAKPLDRLFNRGPYPVGGDDTTIWNTHIYYHSVDNDQMTGPACRFVVDLGDLSRSLSLNAPGQSGQPGSRHYADRIQAWLEGDYHPMLFSRLDVVAQAEATLHLLA